MGWLETSTRNVLHTKLSQKIQVIQRTGREFGIITHTQYTENPRQIHGGHVDPSCHVPPLARSSAPLTKLNWVVQFSSIFFLLFSGTVPKWKRYFLKGVFRRRFCASCYSKIQDAMDELIIAGTSSLHRAIKSIQCLRQHDLPHHTWHTSPCLGKSKFYDFTPMFV